MIKAFFISNSDDEKILSASFNHLKKIANRYGKLVEKSEVFGFKVILVGSIGETRYNPIINESLEFELKTSKHSAESDRFIKIKLNKRGIHIENDYAGTIPCFYSNRYWLSISNIEPCVYISSKSSLEDLSPENLYGYLKYGHFIWEETAWRHIYQMLPDSTYEFDSFAALKSKKYKRSVTASDARFSLGDAEVADELYELNNRLVINALEDYREVILPLSSGYDSRMIFSVLANNLKLRERTRCYTYGSEGSIEVEAARRLTQLSNIKWSFIDLPCRFLEEPFLFEIADVFGASLHMHGMYQLEFYREIETKFGIQKGAAITSGFMTGVPAGQHTGLLGIKDDKVSLTEAMNRFTQSKCWLPGELEKLPISSGNNYIEQAECRFREAFDRFDGYTFQKVVMFDVWTRQRNFISYYPRTLEWMSPTISPHMNPEYANFFLSLKKCHLSNRKAVELLFDRHYKKFSAIISNSNGLRAISSPFETYVFFISRIANRLGLNGLLPKPFQNRSFEFNLKALRKVGVTAFYPACIPNSQIKDLTEWAGGTDYLKELLHQSLSGNIQAYSKFIRLQSILISLSKF